MTAPGSAEPDPPPGGAGDTPWSALRTAMRTPAGPGTRAPAPSPAGVAVSRAESPVGTLRAGLGDITAGLLRWPVWLSLTWRTIRSQYRRTYLGPWWITLQTVIFVVGLSLLFGVLLGQDLAFFVPYVAIGFVVFQWMTTMILSGAASLTGNADSIHTSTMPLSVYGLRGVAAATIQFAHDCLVIAVALVVCGVSLGWSLGWLPVAVAVTLVNGVACALWLGPLVARYRDVGPIVNALVRVLFFFTPVFWVTTDLTVRQQVWLSGWNPLAYLLAFIRDPLLGLTPPASTIIVSIVLTVANIGLGVLVFSRTRTRIAYWT